MAAIDPWGKRELEEKTLDKHGEVSIINYTASFQIQQESIGEITRFSIHSCEKTALLVILAYRS